MNARPRAGRCEAGALAAELEPLVLERGALLHQLGLLDKQRGRALRDSNNGLPRLAAGGRGAGRLLGRPAGRGGGAFARPLRGQQLDYRVVDPGRQGAQGVCGAGLGRGVSIARG